MSCLVNTLRQRLSTVDQQTIQMGRSALGLLVDLIEKKKPTATGSKRSSLSLY